MPSNITLRQLIRATTTLATAGRQAAARHEQNASVVAREAQDAGRIADQIASLHVDAATISDTREASSILRQLHDTATGYRTAAQEFARTAAAAGGTAATTHNGIQEAVDRSGVGMAARTWYTQE